MESIRRISLNEEVVKKIKQMIISGEYSVGDKLPSESEICSKLQVGRSTIREAMRVLQALGFLQIKPGRGTFVVKTTEVKEIEIYEWIKKHEIQFEDFIEVRMAIEPLSIKLAILRASDKEIAMLKKAHEYFIQAVKDNDLVKLMSYDELFHNCIAEATHESLIIDISKKILEAFNQFRSKTFAVDEIYQNALKPHERILKAFEKRDISLGVSAIKDHLNITRQDMRRIAQKINN